MKKELKSIARRLAAMMAEMPTQTSLNIHNQYGEDHFLVAGYFDGKVHKDVFFSEDNADEWDERAEAFETYGKANDSFPAYIKNAVFEIVESALRTTAYTSVRLYPRQVEDDGEASLQVYSSIGDATVSESFYEGDAFPESSLAKILTAHKIMRKEAKNGNN